MHIMSYSDILILEHDELIVFMRMKNVCVCDKIEMYDSE